MLESQSPSGREAWRIREHKRLLGACQKFQVLLAFPPRLTPNEFLLREIADDGHRWIAAERNDLDRCIWRNPEPLRFFPASRHRNWDPTKSVREVSISKHTIIWRWVERRGPEVHRRLRGEAKNLSNSGTL
jgi:hypothetical protein